MEGRLIQTGDIGLQVLEAGRGGRPLLLLHGFTGAKEDFAPWLELLGVLGWHAVAPDHRGHGGSEKPAGEEAYSLDQFAADAVALADVLGWSRFVLVGHSMGGMVAQRIALQHPDRLVALVLMDTAHGPLEGVDPEDAALGRQVVSDGGLELLVELQRERGDVLDTPAHRRLASSRPGYAEWSQAKTLACSADMWLGVVPELLGCEDRLEALRACPVPTLVMVGEQDAMFVGPCERLAKAVPGARLAVIPDAGHSPQFESPDAWWQALTAFLEEVS